MVLTPIALIGGIASVALAAVQVYNYYRRTHGDGVATTVNTMRQGAGVLSALVTAVVAVLDALQLISRTAPAAAGAFQRQGPALRIGRPVRDDDGDDTA